MSHLINSFNDHFEVVTVDSAELQREAFRVRYQVLCLDAQVPDFEADKFPDGMERDRFDPRSVQSLLRYRPTGEYVGTVRLILSDPDDPASPLPIEEHAGAYFDNELVKSGRLPRKQIAEISRLIIKRDFRAADANSSHPYFSSDHLERFPEDRRNYSLPFFGILSAILRMTAQNDISYWYGGMEQTLYKRLARVGLEMTPIGPTVSYHGLRRPYLGDVTQLVDNSYFHHRPIWNLVTENGSIWPAPANAGADDKDCNELCFE